MALNVKVLGQLAPSATTLETLYTVPNKARTVASSLVICNRGSATTFRAAVAIAGETDATKQYLYYDADIDANDTFVATVGMTLSGADAVRVYAGSANLSFNLFGEEQS